MKQVLCVLIAVALLGCDDTSTEPADGSIPPDSSLADSVAVDAWTVEAALADLAGQDAVPPDTSLPDQAPLDSSAPVDAGDPCAVAKQAVQAEIDRIGHCSAASDCTFTYGSCPFGCHIPHNKTESIATLNQLISVYAGMTQCPQCTYKCAPPGTLSCTANVCQMNYP